MQICKKSDLKGPEKFLGEVAAGNYGCTLRYHCGSLPLAVKIQQIHKDFKVFELKREVLIQYLLSDQYDIAGVPILYSFYKTPTLPVNVTKQLVDKCLNLKEDWAKRIKAGEKGQYGILISEFATNGQLLGNLKAISQWHPLQLKGFIFNLLVSIYQMHEAGCVHNDLKPENIVVTEAGNYVNRIIITKGRLQQNSQVHHITRRKRVKGGQGHHYQEEKEKEEEEQQEEVHYFRLPDLVYHPLIIDFGFSIMPWFADHSESATSGSPFYIPLSDQPDILPHVHDAQYKAIINKYKKVLHRGYAGDIYSMGVILLDIILGVDIIDEIYDPIEDSSKYSDIELSIITWLIPRFILNDPGYDALVKDVFKIKPLPKNKKLMDARAIMEDHPLTPALLRMTSFNPIDRVDQYGGCSWIFIDPYFQDLQTSKEGLYQQQRQQQQSKSRAKKRLDEEEHNKSSLLAHIELSHTLPKLSEKDDTAKLQQTWITVDFAQQIEEDSKE